MHQLTPSIWCPVKMGVNTPRVHLIQLQRKPEPKEVDDAYGKKVKDISCRAKTAKEEWKEREASTNQPVPTRIKIFDGGSVKHKLFQCMHRLSLCSHLKTTKVNVIFDFL